MRRMKCRNGLVFVAAIGIGLMVTSVHGGSLDAPAAPDNTNSAMWTLNDIYDVLDTRTTNVAKRISFMEPTTGPTNGTMHTLDDIMTLVTNRAPMQKTGQTTSYATRDDGALEVGVAWPTQRFTAQANTNCILDNLTGLIWAQNANQFGTVDWGTAVTNCNNLDYGGQTDWRLPNWQELRSLIDASTYDPPLPTGYLSVFSGIQTGVGSLGYWASTTYAGGMNNAWTVDMHYGCVGTSTKVIARYVWPIRGGQ